MYVGCKRSFDWDKHLSQFVNADECQVFLSINTNNQRQIIPTERIRI
jgi:hypothetical protein